MIYTELTNEAMKIAYAAHNGQVDESGVPYIFHPFHLAEQMQDEFTTCIALLHDVIEDTNVTYTQLARKFPKEVTDALLLLTHREGVDYLDYVRAIKRNRYATIVKLADIEHNSDQSRFEGSGVSQERLQYFRDKYANANSIVLDEDESSTILCHSSFAI